MSEIRILVCGDRNWTDADRIKDMLSLLVSLAKVAGESVAVIQGGCRGADIIGRAAALDLGCYVEQYDADWDLHGKAAGPIRNLKMIEDGKPDLALVFHTDLFKSKGTKNMVKLLKKHKAPYVIVDH